MAEKTFKWCGLNWKPSMDGGRLIHPEHPWYWYSSDVIMKDANGVLELSIRKNPKDIKHWNGKIYHPEYEVATMRSLESFDYGVFSCEMQMPKGKNLSASFWLSGEGNWPPEIDIEEGWTEEKDSWFRYTQPYFPWIKLGWRTTNNVHYRESDLSKTHVGSRNIPLLKQTKDPAENFIEYKCEWKPDEIVFYAGGKKVRTIGKDVAHKMVENLNNPEKGHKMNIIFNVWCEDPSHNSVEIYQPLKIRNLKFEEFN